MDADGLVRAIRAALDETERIAPDLHERDCAVGTYAFDTDCYCDVPAAVLRRVAADREIVDMHEPCGDCGPGWSHRPECHRCAVEAPCSHILALARGLGINPEQETPQ